MLYLCVGQLGQVARELRDATAAALAQDAISFGRGADPDHSRITSIALALDETVALHADNQSSHGGRAYLLGAGQLTQCLGASEHHNRECRKARWRNPARVILLAQATQQMNGRRVNAVRQRSTVVRVAQGSCER